VCLFIKKFKYSLFIENVMGDITRTFNLVEIETNLLQENIQMISYSLICFLIPFLLGHPQWLIGSLVNCALILGALNLKFNKVLPIILLPSIGVMSAGLIFGSFSIFLLYLVPFIWIGNSIIVYGMKYFNLHKKQNYILSLLISSGAKSLFLFLFVFVLVSFSIIPAPMLTAFGIFQLYTALIGGTLAYGIQKAKNYYLSNE
jgi:hypothetical protein